MKSDSDFVFVFCAEYPTFHSCFFWFTFGVKRKRELNSSLVVADHGIQPAETQSILVPGHHRNGQDIQHVQREELIPAAGWGGVCVLQGVGSSVAEGVVARACVRACVRCGHY